MQLVTLILLAKIFIIFILPMFWWYLGLFTPLSGWIFAWVNFLLLVAIIIYERQTLKDLGLRLDSISSGIQQYALFTACGSIGIYILANLNGKFFTSPTYYLLLISLPVSFLQEFAYRGYLLPKLQQIFHRIPITIILNAIIFTLPHTIYPNMPENLSVIFIAGIGFALMYYKKPNLYLITITHAILHFVATGFGYFQFSN